MCDTAGRLLGAAKHLGEQQNIWVSSSGVASGNLSFADVLSGAKETAELSATELLADCPQSKSTLRISGAPMVRTKWSNSVR